MSLNNSVTICGNLTRDPEMKYLPNGTPMARFTVAINDNYKGKDGQEMKKTHFIDCTCWRALAEGVIKLRKGSNVIVTGSLEQETWEDKNTHEKKSKIGIKASLVGETCWAKAGAPKAPAAAPASEPAHYAAPEDDNVPY